MRQTLARIPLSVDRGAPSSARLRARPTARLLSVCIALLLSAPVAASEESEQVLRDEVAALRARLEQLEAKLSAAVPTPVAPAPPTATSGPSVALGKRGLSVRDDSNGFEIKLRGGLQLDHRDFLGGDRLGADGSFTFRRVRPTLEGKLGTLAAFRITPELAGDSVTLLDAWMDLNFNPAFGLRIGRMKGPVSLERLVSFSALPMIERGYASELAPNRALGVQGFGMLASGKVQYALGVFNGGPDGRNDASSDGDNHADLQGRLFFEPWRGSESALAGLGFGVAATIGDRDGSGNGFLPRYRTPGQDVFFSHRSTVEAHGEHARWSPQLYWYHDRFGLLAEHIVSRQNVRLAADPSAATKLSHSAWSVTGSWVLTGESASYRGIGDPTESFSPSGEGWGAFELVGRLGELDVDDEAFPLFANPESAASRARSWGIGLNWYLSSNVKLQFDHQRTRFDGGSSGAADRPDERTFFSRVQLAF